MLIWTRWETLYFVIVGLIPTVLYEMAGLKWMQLPWLPIALVGTAVAFLIGFQNDAAYGRIWSARETWGEIVSKSSAWGMMVKDMINNQFAKEHATAEELYGYKKTLMYRHIAWLVALRYAMRAETKPWEVFREAKANREWINMITIPELSTSLEDELKPLLSEEDFKYIMSKKNKASLLLSLQSTQLKALEDKGFIWEFSYLELEAILVSLLDLQAKTQSIKEFPYPRQYATLGYDFVRIFVLLIPFGVIPEFAHIGESIAEVYPTIGSLFIWLAIPFTVIVSWIFNTMQKIGTVGENPFEGSGNDVPISTISRGIEIELREMLDEDADTIPAQYPIEHGVQM